VRTPPWTLDRDKIAELLPEWKVFGEGHIVARSPDGITTARFQHETITFGKGRGANTVHEWTCRVDGQGGFKGLGDQNPPAYELLCRHARNAWEWKLERRARREREAEERAMHAAEVVAGMLDACGFDRCRPTGSEARAWRVEAWDRIVGIVSARSRGAAKAVMKAGAEDANYNCTWSELHAVRAPEYDPWAADASNYGRNLVPETVEAWMEDRGFTPAE